jgi:hypothetical protein
MGLPGEKQQEHGDRKQLLHGAGVAAMSFGAREGVLK